MITQWPDDGLQPGDIVTYGKTAQNTNGHRVVIVNAFSSLLRFIKEDIIITVSMDANHGGSAGYYCEIGMPRGLEQKVYPLFIGNLKQGFVSVFRFTDPGFASYAEIKQSINIKPF